MRLAGAVWGLSVIVLLSACHAPSQTIAPPATPPAETADESTYRAAIRALDQLATHPGGFPFEPKRRTSAEALAVLAEQSPIPVHIDWVSLNQALVDAEDPILVPRATQTWLATLDATLARVQVTGDRPVGYTVVHGELWIAAQQDLDRDPRFGVTRAYAVDDLIEPAMLSAVPLDDAGLDPKAVRYFRLLQDEPDPQPEARVTYIDGGIFGADPVVDVAVDHDDYRTAMIDSLRQTVVEHTGGKGVWEDSDSRTRLQFRDADGTMVVTATALRHREVEALLDRLRSVQATNRGGIFTRAVVTMLLLEADRQRFGGPGGPAAARVWVARAWELAPNDPVVRQYTRELNAAATPRGKETP